MSIVASILNVNSLEAKAAGTYIGYFAFDIPLITEKIRDTINDN